MMNMLVKVKVRMIVKWNIIVLNHGKGATPGLDSHGSFQTSGEVIAREDSAISSVFYIVLSIIILLQNGTIGNFFYPVS
jgi:hypothetical protein